METRARRHGKRCLPPELWCIILSYLTPQEAAKAASISQEFASISRAAAEKACERLFPRHRHRIEKLLRQDNLSVQKVLGLIRQHEDEAASHPDVQKANQVQKLVLPEHRQIAVEWLIEVAWDWQLESTVVYRGAQYLDHYLAAVPVPALIKFQMLAISTLRTALKHSSKLAERERAKLPYKNWAEVTDGACTEAEVRSTCTRLERLLQQKHRDHPNAKQRLRYLWYRLYEAGVVRQEHVYVYMLSSFLLHLSILDSSLSALTPTLLATAALALSLETFRFSPWPAALQEHSVYLQEDLQEAQELLRKIQEELPAEQLRNLWVHSYSYIGTNPLQQPAYSHLQAIVRQRGAMQQLGVVLNGIGCNPSSSAAAAATNAAATTAVAGNAVTTRAASSSMALAAAAAAGLADGTVVVGVVPAAAAHPLPAQMPAPVGRVTTRAAAAACHLHLQQRQQQAAHALLGTAASASSSRHAYGVAGSGEPQEQHRALSDRSLPTPQRISLAPVGFGAAELAGRAGPAAVGAASLMAGLVGGLGSSSGNDGPILTPAGAAASASAAAGAGSATRRATRELPARRAVASSRYGCRLSTAAAPQGAAPSATGAGSSSAAGMPAVARAPTAAVDGSFSAGMLAAPPGSTTPASPKLTAAGHRGLAALFAGAGMAAGVRTRSSDMMLQRQQWGSADLESLIEGTPQPPQLINLPAQLHTRMLDAAQARHVMAGKGVASAVPDQGLPGPLSGSSMLAACQAAAAAAGLA